MKGSARVGTDGRIAILPAPEMSRWADGSFRAGWKEKPLVQMSASEQEAVFDEMLLLHGSVGPDH